MTPYYHHYHHHQYLRRGAFVCDRNADGDDFSTSSTVIASGGSDKMIELVKMASTSAAASSSPQQQDNPYPQEDADHHFGYDKSSSASRILRKRNVVRFDETLNQEYDNTCMCREDCRFLWYNHKQLQQFKDANYAEAQEIILQSKKAVSVGPISCQRLLRLTYKACCRPPNDGEDGDENSSSILLTASSLQPEQEASLKLWLGRLAPCWLGRDRLVARANAVDIYWRRMKMKRIIFNLQQEEDQEMASSTSATDNNNDQQHDKENDNNNKKAELICSSCQALSRPARLYAQHLAQAQASHLSPARLLVQKQQQQSA